MMSVQNAAPFLVEVACLAGEWAAQLTWEGLGVVLTVFLFPASSGPQKCAACLQEGLYEEGASILETGVVSAAPSSGVLSSCSSRQLRGWTSLAGSDGGP